MIQQYLVQILECINKLLYRSPPIPARYNSGDESITFSRYRAVSDISYSSTQDYLVGNDLSYPMSYYNDGYYPSSYRRASDLDAYVGAGSFPNQTRYVIQQPNYYNPNVDLMQYVFIY